MIWTSPPAKESTQSLLETINSNSYLANCMLPVASAVPVGLGLGKGDALLIVPPFASLRWPYLGVHVLQSYARRLGFEVSILYANFYLAASIGVENYEAFTDNHKADHQIGERFLARAAYGLPPFGSDDFIDSEKAESLASKCRETYPNFKIAEIKALERRAALWADDIADLVAAHDFKVVGCSTSFEQTAASIALLNRVKQLRPDMLTILGGANCEGIMAKGLLSLSNSVDYVFSGECEAAFPDFLARVREGRLPSERIVRGSACIEMDDMPLPDYAEFYHQRRLVLPGHPEEKIIAYQSSKGCWWGEAHQCAFCGLNGENIKYRHKSAEKVISDLRELREKHPGCIVNMVDNVIPSEYFRTLIPRLERELPGIYLIYYVRASLSLEEVAALKRAGLDLVYAGIESLSTPSLKLMRKGTTSRQNISFLRYARSVGLPVFWNMMHDIPGEQLEDLERLLSLMPLLHHLQPPTFTMLAIDRFSLYFSDPAEYGLSNIRPFDFYFAVLPESADVESIAYHFKADYKSAFRDHPEVRERLKKEIDIWRSLWRLGCIPPSLEVISVGDGKFMVLDTRGLPGTKPVSFISRDEAKVALSNVGLKKGDRLMQWAVDKKLVAEVDSTFVPLATGSPDLILEFEK